MTTKQDARVEAAVAKRLIPHREAKEIVLRLIAGAFNRDDSRPRFSIPCKPEYDDDCLIIAYIEQQEFALAAADRVTGEADTEATRSTFHTLRGALLCIAGSASAGSWAEYARSVVAETDKIVVSPSPDTTAAVEAATIERCANIAETLEGREQDMHWGKKVAAAIRKGEKT